WHVGSGPVPTGAVDLGTVMRHELGHILGYGDLDPATAGDSIMSGTILPGKRRAVADMTPEAGPVSTSNPSNPVASQQTRPGLSLSAESEEHSEAASVALVPAQRQRDTNVINRSSAVRKPAAPLEVSGRVIPAAGFDAPLESADISDLKNLDALFSNPLEAF
ncbi:MAG: hypothetical protein ACK5X8_09705, partial [Planctomyces sp.]